jgi:3-methyladenine DNA glycosylase Tag
MVVPRKKPTNDSIYFEKMCRVIFQAGLNWHVIDGKWGGTKKAFSNFNIEKVACYTNADVLCLMNGTGIVRNKGKIQAIIQTHKTSSPSKNDTVHSKNTSTASTNQTTTQTQLRI